MEKKIRDKNYALRHRLEMVRASVRPLSPFENRGGGAHGKGYYGLHRAVQSREGLMMWLCRLHNIINRDTGNEEFECTPIGLDMVYLKNCGDCQVKKKPEGDSAGGEEEEEHASQPGSGFAIKMKMITMPQSPTPKRQRGNSCRPGPMEAIEKPRRSRSKPRQKHQGATETDRQNRRQTTHNTHKPHDDTPTTEHRARARSATSST